MCAESCAAEEMENNEIETRFFTQRLTTISHNDLSSPLPHFFHLILLLTLRIFPPILDEESALRFPQETLIFELKVKIDCKYFLNFIYLMYSLHFHAKISLPSAELLLQSSFISQSFDITVGKWEH